MSNHREQSELSFREDDDLRIVRPEPTICKISRSTFFVCGFGILLAFAVIGISMAMMHSALPAFHETITADGILTHLEAFQTIADENGGSRSILQGFNASVQYVYDLLKEETNFELTLQEFEVNAWKEEAAPVLQVEGDEGAFVSQDSQQFQGLSYSGSGEAIGLLTTIPNYGCNQTDFNSVTEGTIFLMKRGGCNFSNKTINAQSAGAIGVIIISDGAVFSGTLGAGSDIAIPTIAVSLTLGTDLLSLGSRKVRIVVTGSSYLATSYNILASTKHGSDESVVILGSHLDSVDGGAGINDNGSGSAGNLEIALAFYKNSLRPKNKVIFAWFGAEENGLLGSTHYVKTLKEAGALSNVAAYLNMDMIGSPNYIRAIYNGEEAEDEAIRVGSARIQKFFEAHFEEHSLDFELTDFDGRSDYGPFIQNGIPAGGVFSGAEKLKTLEERKKYGGLAQVPYDPCYHLSCDTIENINQSALYELTRAMANVIYDISHTSNLKSELSQST